MNILMNVLRLMMLMKHARIGFLQIARQYIPNRIVKIRPNDAPWYNNELRCLKRKMQRLFRKYRNQKNSVSWEWYKNARNEYQLNLTTAEDKYHKERSESLAQSKNTKTWWNTAKWLLGKGRDSLYPPIEVNGENEQSRNRVTQNLSNVAQGFLSSAEII